MRKKDLTPPFLLYTVSVIILWAVQNHTTIKEAKFMFFAFCLFREKILSLNEIL